MGVFSALRRQLDTSAGDVLIDWIVGELRRALPPEQAADEARQTVKRRERADERIRRHVTEWSRTMRLNVYQKARFGTRLQDALEHAGYPASFCRPFAYDVVRLMAVSASEPR